MDKKYVFVVCGTAEHLNALHFSLEMLKRFTAYKIIVVTDFTRNELPIEHDSIIDIRTPQKFSNHQAAIYLKTKLHHILPPGYLYCYLDTDVIAIRSGVDSIFDHFRAPITFCTDHCKINTYPNAVYDKLYDDLLEKQNHLTALGSKYQKEEARQIKLAGNHISKTQEIRALFNQNRPAHTQSLWGKSFLKVAFSKAIFWMLYGFARLSYWISLFSKTDQNFSQHLERLHRFVFRAPLNFDLFIQEYGYSFDAKKQKWYDLSGHFLYEEDLVVRSIEAETSFRWDKQAQIWQDEAGHIITQIQSNQLIHLIYDKFGIIISDDQWQHWNGGVFLFDERAQTFMEQWHQWTMQIFEDPRWEIRDQGTLTATVWKFNLQQHATLPLVYNFIADYYHPTLEYLGNFNFQLSPSDETIHPYFIHIYHHWGDQSWQIWRDVEQLIPS